MHSPESVRLALVHLLQMARRNLTNSFTLLVEALACSRQLISLKAAISEDEREIHRDVYGDRGAAVGNRTML